jgi:invasion protein IalB
MKKSVRIVAHHSKRCATDPEFRRMMSLVKGHFRLGTMIRPILTLLLLVPLSCETCAQERTQGKKPSAWVKMCEKRPPAKDISDCMTIYEKFDQTREVLVSAALRQTDGEDKEYFRIMLSPRVQVEQQVQAAIFPEQMWEEMQSNGMLSDKSGEPQNTFSLGFLRCPGSQSVPKRAAGCIAEVEATSELLAKLKGGSGLVVYATSATCDCQVAFPVPLTGFAEALAGSPLKNRHWPTHRPPIWPE